MLKHAWWMGLVFACGLGCGQSGGNNVAVGAPGAKGDQAQQGQGQGQSPVMDPSELLFGRTQGEWGGKWWQFVSGHPVPNHPLVDPTGEFCADGQSGPVFYLFGSIDAPPKHRTCTLSKDKYLFFPIINTSCGVVYGLEPNIHVLEKCAKDSQDDPDTTASLQIDGQDYPIFGDAIHTPYRQPSGAYAIVLPDDSFDEAYFGLSPQPEGAVSVEVNDGVQVAIRPLSPGQHNIHMRGTGTDGYVNDVTYDLTVTQ